MKSSPSSSEGALTSLRPDLPLRRQRTIQSGVPTMDRFLSHLGDPGRYQIIIMILLAANCIPVVVNHLLMAFYAVKTAHNCRVPDGEDKSLWLPPYESVGGSSNRTAGLEPLYAECEMYKNASNHSLGTQPCVDGYEFHLEGNEWNIIAEWGLVCDREYVAPLITTTYFCGVMLGGVFFGSFSDKFGRKNMMLICLYTQCMIGIGIHFVRRLVVFIGLRFIQGIFIQGLQCVTYAMVMELFSPQYRALAGCVIEAFWAMGVILLALIAKYVQHWRYIQLAINIPTIATIFYIWIVPESVRWLLSRGKFSRAEKIVRTIASNNSLRLDPGWLRDEMEEVGRIVVLQVPDKYPDIRDMLTHRGIRRHTLVLFFVWFAVSLSYYGISFSIPDLSGDRYLNFMIGGGIELGAYMLAFVVLNGFGRKYPLMVYLLLSGILCISVVSVRNFVPATWVDVEALSTGLALIGKAAIVSCFCIIFIYSSEIFPTVIRTVGVGACAFWGRVGSLLAPQILLLGKHINSSSPELVTFMTFGALSFVAGICTLHLPETWNKDLPDTVNEAEHLGDHHSPTTNIGVDFDDNTLVRSDACGGVNVAETEEVGYGTSPEWIEVDGLIVSRGAAAAAANMSTMGSSTGAVKPVHGSVLSLPYSSRTQLTYNSSSSGTQRSSGRSTDNDDTLQKASHQRRHHLLSRQYTIDDTDTTEEENPYETIPADIVNNHQIKEDHTSSAGGTMDESVISAHDIHSGIYDIISKMPSTRREENGNSGSSSNGNSIDAVQGYFFRKKLLIMQDANETRL